jgi:hypothetical protein
VHYDQEKAMSPLGILCSCFSIKEKSLFIVDDKMYLTCYSFADILTRMENTDYQKEKTESERKQLIYSKVFEEISLTKKWAIKAHSEVIKNV